MIQHPVLVKQALLKVVLQMKYATSLPWLTVRSAWAMSIHDIKDGHL